MKSEARELLRSARLARRHLDALEGQLVKMSGTNAEEALASAAAERIQARRRGRYEFLAADLFGEAGWDLLLALYLARANHNDIYSYALFREAGVRPTTGARMLDKMETVGVVERRPCPTDRRQTFISLTEHGFERMTRMLCEMESR